MLKKIIMKRSESGSLKFDLIALISIIIACVFLGLIIFKMSPSMDEYLPYHQLACIVNGTQNIFRESCSDNNLILFGKSLQLRSFSYVGFSNSILYLPFYLVWKSYLSARILKLILLLLVAILSIKITKVNWKIGLVIATCFFPFAFQMIVDTGPIAFQCFTMVLVIYLFQKEKIGLRDGLVAGLVAFFAVEQKMFFAPFLVPVGIYCLVSVRKSFSEIIRFFLPIVMIAGTGLIALLNLKTISGITYFSELSSKFSRISLLDFNSQWDHLLVFKPFLVSFYNFAERIFDTGKIFDLNTFGFYLVSILILVIAVQHVNFKRNSREISSLLAGVIALVISIWLLAISKDSVRAHHLAIVLPFFILGLMSLFKIIESSSQKLAYFLAVAFLIPNFLILNRALGFTSYPQDDWSRLEVIHYLDSSKTKDAYVVSDWGIYYLLSLYSRRNTPVYFEDINTPTLARSVGDLKSKGYNVYLVARQNPISKFYQFEEIKYNNKVNNWHLYKIYENNR